MKKFLVLFLFLSGCKETPPFPAKSILEYIPETNECYEYVVVSQDPLKVSDGKLVSVDNCKPSLIGFHIDQAGDVFQYIRDLQELAKKRCK